MSAVSPTAFRAPVFASSGLDTNEGSIADIAAAMFTDHYTWTLRSARRLVKSQADAEDVGSLGGQTRRGRLVVAGRAGELPEQQLEDGDELMAKVRPARRAVVEATNPRTARKLRPEEVEALIANYRATGSAATTAREFGITRQTVGQHLAKARISAVSRMNDEQQTHSVRRYREGASASAIGREIGFSTHVVLNVLRSRGARVGR